MARRGLRPFGEDLGLQEIFHHLHGHYARSFPARFPLLSLDRIYVRGLVPHHAEVLRGAPWGALSDHLPLAASYYPLSLLPMLLSSTLTHTDPKNLEQLKKLRQKHGN